MITDPKWQRRIVYVLLAIFLCLAGSNAVCAMTSASVKESLGLTFVLALGLVFVGAGLLGEDFHWGDDGNGPPAPKELGALMFGGVGLLFALLGVAGSVSMLISIWRPGLLPHPSEASS